MCEKRFSSDNGNWRLNTAVRSAGADWLKPGETTVSAGSRIARLWILMMEVRSSPQATAE